MKQIFLHLKYTRFIFLFTGILLFTSCLGPKKAMLKKLANDAKQVQVMEKKVLQHISNKKSEKLDDGSIDSIINTNIINSLARYNNQQDTAAAIINFMEQAAASRRNYKKSLGQLQLKETTLTNYIAAAAIRLRRYTLISDGLDIAKQNEFDLGAFFGPGKYKIPEDKIDIAYASFSPIIDSLITFYNKYDDVNKVATLVILGFADGQNFNTESDVYLETAQQIKNENPPKEIVNQKLSELRAENLGNTIEAILKKRIKGYDEKNPDFLFAEKGKGEQYPNNKIKDYKDDDERRRVVLFYWSILPKE